MSVCDLCLRVYMNVSQGLLLVLSVSATELRAASMEHDLYFHVTAAGRFMGQSVKKVDPFPL